MNGERIIKVDFVAEIDRYFDDSSLAGPEGPSIVILLGGVASGKTTIRKQRYATGYVLVDAAEIFLRLSRGEFLPFPGVLEEPMRIIGSLVAKRAVLERRNIVTELIGADIELVKSLIDAMRAVGYRVEGQGITCDVEVAQKRNESRDEDSISSSYAEDYQRAWLQDAATAALGAETEESEG